MVGKEIADVGVELVHNDKGKALAGAAGEEACSKEPVAKEMSANDAARSNVNDDDYGSLSECTPVPSALKQHRIQLNILPEKTSQSLKTPHPKSPTKCLVSTCSRPAIASKLQVRAILDALRLFADFK